MVSQDIKHLFDEYAAGYNRLDAAAIPAFYAEWAMAAAPNFVGCTQNNEALLAAIEQAYAFYQSIGMCSAEILALDETTLDERYSLVRVQWATKFQRTGDEPITFAISYLVWRSSDGPRIILFISHEDELAVMRAKGLIPGDGE